MEDEKDEENTSLDNQNLQDENVLLDNENVNLLDEVDSDEDEMQPPKEDSNENHAMQLNVGNIFAIIFIVIVVLLMIFMIVGSKKKKAAQNIELDKSGTKIETDFDIKDNSKSSSITKIIDDVSKKNQENENTETDVDEILNTLPDNLKLPNSQQTQGTAQIAPIGTTNQSSTYVSDRPDTKNSKSPRKIEGIKGLEYSEKSSNANLIANTLTGRNNYENSSSNVTQTTRPSREEYIAQQMETIQKMQATYSNQTNNNSTDYQSNKENFFSNQANSTGNGNYLAYNTLWDGTIIPGALITAINTDNPGIVIARVTENVWSSYDQSLLLIPEGTLLYATYNSSVSYGQNRIQVAWNLLIRPDGYRLQLGNMNGVDSQGASGYKGFVNNHPFETLKALGLVAVFSVIQTEITSQINTANNEYVQNAMSDVYSQASQMGNKILDKALDIKPTIKIKEGTEIKFITNVPLELPPVEIPEVSGKYVRN